MSDEWTRDPVVARAVRGIPVPDHEPGFWDQLEARLADEPGQRDADVVAELPRRRPRLRAALLATAALVLVAALATALVVDRRRDREIAPVTEPAPPTTVATTPATTSTTAPVLDPESQEAAAAVERFVAALNTDAESAFAMLTAASQDFLGSADTLAAGHGGRLASWGAADAVGQVYVTFARAPAGADVAIVAYAGTIDIDGTPGRHVQAFAAARDGDDWRIDLEATVEPASGGAYIELTASNPLAFVLAMEPNVDSVTVAIDGESVDPAELELVGETLSVRRQPGPGAHVVTVAVVLPDGVVYAAAEEVTVS